MKASSRQWILLIQAWITGLALSVKLTVEEVEYSGIHHSILSRIYTMLEQLQQGMEDQGLILTVLTLGIFFLYRKIWLEFRKNPIRGSRLLSAVLSFLYLGGLAFYFDDSLSILWRYKVNLIRSVYVFLGIYWLYLACINLLYVVLHEGVPSTEKNEKKGGIRHKIWSSILCAYHRHTFVFSFLVIMICWVPHLILRYPGAMSYDNYNELMYYYGYKTYTTAQPVFHTWLFGTFVNAGVSFGNPNAGLFAFVVVSSIVMALVLSASCCLMLYFGTPKWLRYLTFAIYCFVPYYTGYAAFPIKDYLYTAFFVSMILMIMAYIQSGGSAVLADKKGKVSKKKRILLPLCWIVCCTLMMLCRNNGIYVYFITAVLSILVLVKESKGIALRARYLVFSFLCLLLPFAADWAVETTIKNAYDVQQDSAKEMFSLPFQQTARYVRDYGDEVTQEEEEAIADVLNYDELAELYDESISDPVKSSYHAETTDDLVAYFKVWLQQFFKHPLCYIEATWNQNYSLFAPWVNNIVYNQDCHVGVDIWDQESPAPFHFTIPDWMDGFAQTAVSLYAALTMLPVVGMFSNVAAYVILLFVLLLFFLIDKRAKEARVFIPLVVSFLFILLSPAILAQPRYAFPIIYSMPSVVAMYAAGKKKGTDEKTKE